MTIGRKRAWKHAPFLIFFCVEFDRVIFRDVDQYSPEEKVCMAEWEIRLNVELV